MRRLAILWLAVLPSSVLADTVICTATTQCRGDAQRMCAPSRLEIRIHAGRDLWIDRQGPYPATADRSGALVVTALGAGYRLERDADGGFTWYGNRAKRFHGTCVAIP